MKQEAMTITDTMRKTLDQLQAAHPEAGFVLIGLSDEVSHTEVSMAHNIDDDVLSDILTDIADSKGVTIFPAANSKALH